MNSLFKLRSNIFKINIISKDIANLEGEFKCLQTLTRRNYSAKNGSKNNRMNPSGWLLLLIPGTTFALGCWQIKRKIWKENLIQEIQMRIYSDPISLPESKEELYNLEYRPVTVKGKFIHSKEMYLGPRSFINPTSENRKQFYTPSKERIGYLVITPLKLTENEKTILVNRGWVPKDLLKPETRQKGQIEGEVELTGVVRLEESRPPFTPHFNGNIYLYRDINKMCSETGADAIFIDANYESTIPNGPIGGQTTVTLRNDHLSYIITWFSLSAATSYLWFKKIFQKAI